MNKNSINRQRIVSLIYLMVQKSWSNVGRLILKDPDTCHFNFVHELSKEFHSQLPDSTNFDLRKHNMYTG